MTVLCSIILLSFGFGLHLLMQPWPSPRAGCASVKHLRRDQKSNAVFAPPRRETASVFLGGRCLTRAEGRLSLSRASGSEEKRLTPAGEILRDGPQLTDLYEFSGSILSSVGFNNPFDIAR